MHFSFSMPGQLLHSIALKNRNLQTFAFLLSDTSLQSRAHLFLCYTWWALIWRKHHMFMPFSSNLVQPILLYFTLLQAAFALLVSVGGHPGLVSLLSDWQTDKPSCLGPVGCRWTQIAGPWWMTADRGLTATGGRDRADLSSMPLLPLAEHFGGHCGSLDLCKHASLLAGEVLSNRGAKGCGCCLEVINWNKEREEGQWV